MTDLVTSSANLRAEGDDLRGEIDRHAKAMYDRLERMEQRLLEELRQVQALKNRFGWVGPVQQVEQQTQRIRAVEASNRGLQSLEKKHD